MASPPFFFLPIRRAPFHLGLAAPIACLLAPLIVLGRLRASAELTALAAAGVSAARMMRPLALLFAAIAVAAFGTAEHVAPCGNRAAAAAVMHMGAASARTAPAAAAAKAPQSPPLVALTFEGSGEARTCSVAPAGPLRSLLYARAASDGGLRLHDVALVTAGGGGGDAGGACALGTAPPGGVASSPTPGVSGGGAVSSSGPRGVSPLCPDRVLVAESATWDAGSGAWTFQRGAEYTRAPLRSVDPTLFDRVLQGARWLGRAASNAASSVASSFSFSDDAPEGLPAAAAPRCELPVVTRFEVLQVGHLGRTPVQVAALRGDRLSGAAFDELVGADIQARVALLTVSREVGEGRRLEVKLAQRRALPLACAIFGPLGALLGLQGRGSDRRRGALPQLGAYVAALSIVVVYYLVNVVGASVGQAGGLSPLMGAMLPNIAGGFVLLAAALQFLVVGGRIGSAPRDFWGIARRERPRA